MNPRRSEAVFEPTRSAASTADRSTASEYVPRIPGGAASGQTTWKSSPTFCARRSRRYSAAAFSRPYSTARSWSALMLATRSFDCPSTTCPSRPTETRSRDVPTNAISSFVRTVTGRRGAAPAAKTGPRRSVRARGSSSSAKTSDFQYRRRADEVRDQPRTVDPGHVEVAGRGRHYLAGFGVNVVALEVQRAPVAVDRDLEFVRRVIRDPVVLSGERRRILQPESPNLVHAGCCHPRTHGHGRVGREQARHQIDVLLRRGTVEVLLDLVDLVDVRLPLQLLLRRRGRARVPAGREEKDDDPECAADQEFPHA